MPTSGRDRHPEIVVSMAEYLFTTWCMVRFSEGIQTEEAIAGLRRGLFAIAGEGTDDWAA